MQCYWPIAEPLVGIAKVDKTKLNQWQRLSWRNVRSNWNDNQTAQFRFDFEGMASNTIAYIDDAMLIDLTAAFGAGNEPTQEWCDTNIKYFAGNTTIQYEAPNKYDLTVTTPTKIQTGDILNCPYSGSAKSITLPKGQYQLECWGAQGGYRSSSSYGGNGGYSVGILNLTQNTTVYLYTGGAGNTGGTAGGFNGGGKRDSYNGGGGGTDIRIGSDSLYARLIVAGGGGSDGASDKNGMYGGGTSGGTTTQNFGSGGGGGTQTTGGTGGNNNAGTFGQGGSGLSSSSGYGGAGGGGWYGGGGCLPDYSGDDDRGGGGGSGYVYTSSTASSYPSGCLLNSSYYLTNAITVTGNTAFTSPTGANETGHTGNGYIRITVIEVDSGNTLIKTTSDTWKEPVQMFVNTGVSTTIPSGLVELEYIESTGVQAIDTLVIAKDITKVVTDFQLVSVVSGTESQVMAVWSDTNNCMQCGSDGTNFMATSRGTTYSQTSNVLARTIGTSAPVGSPNISISIFAQNNTSWLSKAKLYSCKIYKDTTLVRDFIPAKKVSDGMCGLWDKVNYKFYTDINGNNFTAGTEKTAIAAIGTPIEYIQSSGTQYIDSNFIPKATTRTIMKAEPMAWSAWSAFFGTRNTSSPTASQAYIAAIPAATLYRSDYFGSSLTAETPTVMQITDIDKNKNICSFNNIMITNTSSTVNATTNMFLLALNDVGTAKYFLSAKLYSCQIYDGNTLVRDFIPIKTTTNIYGLWDKVNKVFYPNAGTGAFTGGPAVTLTGWHKIKGVWAKTAANIWSQAL